MVKITFNIFFSYNEGMPFNCPTLLLERIESRTRQLISWLTSEFIEWCSIFAVTLHISLISEMKAIILATTPFCPFQENFFN